jgi:DNA topoisomerase-1
VFTISLDRAIEVIEAKRYSDRNKVVKSFEEDSELQILNGRWGPYILYQGVRYKIPKTQDAGALDFDRCMRLIGDGAGKPAKTARKGGKK